MLDSGYTLDGAATALGWSRQLVGARAKILELPQAAQDLIGAARIPVSAIDTLLAINYVSPAILDVLVAAITDGMVQGEQVARDPGWALGSALRASNHSVFAAYLQRISPHEADELQLGKKTDELREQARTLHKGLPDSWEPEPAYRFSEQDVDQARAAGVLIELDRSAPIITDRGVYRELARDAIKRTVAELHDRKAQHAANNKRAAKSTARRPADELDSQHRAAQRELARRAHAVNLDLGSALLNGLSVVDPCDPDVARIFCYAILGADSDQSPYTKTGERVLTLAANGLRLVLADQRSEHTPTLKSGKPGKTKITYSDPEQALAALFNYVDAARTAGELLGRTLVVIAAQRYARQEVLARSAQRPAIRLESHKDLADKAFRKLVEPHLPATLKALQRAIAREAAEHDRKLRENSQGDAIDTGDGDGEDATAVSHDDGEL